MRFHVKYLFYLLSILFACSLPAADKLELKKNDVISFLGGTNMVNMQRAVMLRVSTARHLA